MRISLDRLSETLAASGFMLSYFSEWTHDIVFVKSFSGGLFERIMIRQGYEQGGRPGDFVSASVQCSIVPGRTFLKGMGQHRCVVEVAEGTRRGSTRLRNEAEARAWEARVGSIVPGQAELFRIEHGPAILSSTQAVRELGLKCLEACRGVASSPTQAVALLESRAEAWQLQEYRRIMEAPIPVVPDGRAWYQFAVLAIVLYSGPLKGDARWFVGKKPDSWTDRELMILIQFMVSVASGEPGWPEPFFAV